MEKQTRRLSVAALRFAGAVAFATAWVAPAAAQTATPPAPFAPEAPEQAPPGAPDVGESAPPAGEGPDPSDRQARLDFLFDQLAAAETGDHGRVEQEIQRLWARSGSDTADLLLQRGRDAFGRKETVKAIHHLSALVQHRPGFAEGWHQRATAFYATGELGLALADIERVLALEPRHYGALSGLGAILEALGREADALAAYRAALAVNPHLERVNEAAERLAPKVDGRDI